VDTRGLAEFQDLAGTQGPVASVDSVVSVVTVEYRATQESAGSVVIQGQAASVASVVSVVTVEYRATQESAGSVVTQVPAA